MTRGFVQFPRELLDDPVIGRKPYCRLGAWMWLLSEASYKSRHYDANGITIQLQRGQLCHSVRFIAKAWGWSIGRVQRFLLRLEKDTRIDTRTESAMTVISICKYGENGPRSMTSDTPTDTACDTRPIQKRYRKEEGQKERKKHSARAAARADEPEGFDEWYSTYPRKAQRDGAAKAYRRIVPSRITATELLERTRTLAANHRRNGTDPRYIPYPETWLDKGGWFDLPVGKSADRIQIEEPTRNPRSFTDTEWREVLQLAEKTGTWARFWGPRPGEEGCLVPAHLLISPVQQQQLSVAAGGVSKSDVTARRPEPPQASLNKQINERTRGCAG